MQFEYGEGMADLINGLGLNGGAASLSQSQNKSTAAANGGQNGNQSPQKTQQQLSSGLAHQNNV